METREQNRNNKRTEIERFDWFIERIQTRVAFGWLSERSGEKTSCPRTFSKSIDNSLWRHATTRLANRTSLLHLRVLFGRKRKRPCFDLFIHGLIKQITNTCRNHFSRSYENCSTYLARKSTIAALLDGTFFRALVLLSSNLTKLYENRQNMQLSLIVHSQWR